MTFEINRYKILAVALSAAFFSVHGMVQAEPPVPRIEGPVPGIPYNADSIALQPVGLGNIGYDEHEYFISGQSNVYDWHPNGNFKISKVASGGYTTRIVVRKPIGNHHWNGTVVVEIVNMTGFGPMAGVDYEGVWANNWREITRSGMAYVGITAKPNVFDALRRFDRARYERLSMANPLAPGQQVCGSLPGAPGYNPNLSKLSENGLIFDAITQLGVLLRSDTPGNPLGHGAARLYLTGLSQSAGYLKTYYRFIAPLAKTAEGRPVFDGYRAEASIIANTLAFGVTAPAPISQCAAPLPPDDPQLTIPDRGVPFIELHSSSDFARDFPRQADTPWYRLWEVAGAFHDDTWTFRYGFPAPAVFRKVLPDVGAYEIPRCKYDYPPDPPYEDVYDSSLRALDLWVRQGIAAPKVPHIDDVDGRQTLDNHGNALGGLRLPALSVPVARYDNHNFEPTGDCSHKVRLSRAELLRLYPTHDRYVELVKQAIDDLESRRLLTAEDGQAELLAARQSDVP
ncbi:MAG: alpha/beta hydrolase domain-containing protein [Bradyrhizobium sp.]|nr:alpha/beta hydrolase domain-containing protein [Bradyrhizobium sp.]